MSAIHNPTKILFDEAFARFEEAVRENNTERMNRFRSTIIEVFNNTIDDNARLLEGVQAKKGEQL